MQMGLLPTQISKYLQGMTHPQGENKSEVNSIKLSGKTPKYREIKQHTFK